MSGSPRISFVIPAYRAAGTIGATLASIERGGGRLLAEELVEAIIADDGSPDGEALAQAVAPFSFARVVRHEPNRGVSAARNSGVAASRGEAIIILDADDTMVEDWSESFEAIWAEWPPSMQGCFSACRDTSGGTTVSRPDYSGPLTFADGLNERYVGEYLPMLRGPFIRGRGFLDFNQTKDCTNVSYLSFLNDGPFWITARVLRIYHPWRPGSISADFTDPAKAAQSARCLEALLERFADDYRDQAPRMYRAKELRLAVYRRLAGKDGAFAAWRRGAALDSLPESLGALLVFVLGPRFCAWAVARAKALGVIRRYG